MTLLLWVIALNVAACIRISAPLVRTGCVTQRAFIATGVARISNNPAVPEVRYCVYVPDTCVDGNLAK